MPTGGCSNISVGTFGVTEDSLQVLGLLEFLFISYIKTVALSWSDFAPREQGLEIFLVVTTQGGGYCYWHPVSKG